MVGGCTASLLLLLNGYYEVLLGGIFGLAFVIFALRYARHQYPVDAGAAGLMLGAVLLAQWQMFVVVVIVYGAALLILGLRRRSLPRVAWVMMVLGVPLVALTATAPWWVWR
jgi:hypothetical protein